MISPQELAQELKFLGPVEAQGHGLGWLAKCPGPACDHAKAGLSLAFNQLGPDLVVQCYGGCPDEDLLYALAAVPGFVGLTAHQWIRNEAKNGDRQQAQETVARLLVPPPVPRAYHPTDLGNSERLVSLHGGRIRFSRSLGWMIWRGNRWAPDTTGEVSRLAVDTVRNIYREAADSPDEKDRKALARHAMASEAKGRIKAAIDLTEFAEKVACYGDEFDAHPWYFNCRNGTLDLQTGELLSHRPSDLLTQLSPIAYQPNAVCPTWMRFLEEVMQGNAALISFLQRAVGYSLTGQTREQKFFLCWGEGRNGKGVFLQTLLYLLGDYAKVSQFKTFEEIQDRPNAPRGDLVGLRGKRLAFASENRENMPLAEALIKGVTGNDPLTARQLHREEITFTPSFKLWLACNHKPVIKGTDEAIWERVLFLPWLRYFKPEERDLHLLPKLRQEASGILTWAVQGCLEWQRNGLKPPAEVFAAVAQYRQEMDIFARFLAQSCDQSNPNLSTKSAKLYETFASFCRDESETPPSQKAFSGRLLKLGFQRKKREDGMYWLGLSPKSRNE